MLIRDVIGDGIFELETDLTYSEVGKIVKKTLHKYGSLQPDSSHPSDKKLVIQDELMFMGFAAKFLEPLLDSMLLAICRIKERPYSLWQDYGVRRCNIGFENGQRSSKLKCDVHVGFRSSEDGIELKRIAVVGEAKLSRDWWFQDVRPAVGKGVNGIKGLDETARNPVRQLVSYAHAYKTCWAFILTDHEAVFGRVYKVRATDKLDESLMDVVEYDAAEDQYLGVEFMMPIPWRQRRGPSTMTVLEGLFIWSVLGFNDDFRELVFKDELPPMKDVWKAVGLQLQSHF
ncbi:hypothetical protein F5Y18DRAFT_428068 [Xylariaceae sp. FL1019]|nr:hypothetical protein F5Y18DRAFT_428068 [Xylariaceae sp. FL1019]